MSSKGTSFVTAAFRSAHENEAFIFLNDKYVVENYYPGQAKDEILYGPVAISEGLKSLKGTIFGDYGIDCAFPSSENKGQVYIFKLNKCALLDYSPFSELPDKIIKGPMLITEMFPLLKGTVFENGIDAAFELPYPNQVYIFKGDQYTRMEYGPKPRFIDQPQVPIISGWSCLKGTPFEYGFEAAFASHRTQEAYIFKEEYYGRLAYTPGAPDCKLIGGVKKIKDGFPCLAKLLPNASLNAN